MRKIIKPSIQYLEHFKDCISRKSEEKQDDFLVCYPNLEIASNVYELNASNKNLYQCVALDQTRLNPILKKELKALYTEQMVPSDSPGRATYSKILNSSDICPYCSNNPTFTLDHYLSKSFFPENSILPINLVPCCRDCNSNKPTPPPVNEEKQFIHPYYEDIESIEWLKCDISYAISNKPSLVFSVNELPLELDQVLLSRIKNQFNTLKLAILYSKVSSGELVSIMDQAKKLYIEANAKVVSEHFYSIYKSKILAKQVWQASVYKCVSADERFCRIDWST